MYNPWKILAVSARVRRLHGYGTGAAGRKMRRSPNNILSSDAFTWVNEWVILVILCLNHPWKDNGKAGGKILSSSLKVLDGGRTEQLSMNWGSRTLQLSTFGVGHNIEWPSSRMMEMFDTNQDIHRLEVVLPSSCRWVLNI